MTPMKKVYLGDGAYVDCDGYAIVLTTENGIAVTNTIVLEPDVYRALVRYVAERAATTTAAAGDLLHDRAQRVALREQIARLQCELDDLQRYDSAIGTPDPKA
jgi:hypothetical protein